MNPPYRFSELPYEPTDFDAVGRRLREYTDAVRAAGSAEELMRIDAACDAMLNQGQLHSIFQETAAAQAGIIDWQGELWYSKNEPMNTLTLTIPYR